MDSLTTYSVEYAKSNRAACRGTCKNKIDKGIVRIGKSFPGDGDYLMTHWYHLACIKKPAALTSLCPSPYPLRASQRTVLHVQEAWPQQVRQLGRQVVVERPLPGLGISHAEAVDDLEHPAVEIHVCPGPHLLV